MLDYPEMISRLENPNGSFSQFLMKLHKDHVRKADYTAPAAGMQIATDSEMGWTDLIMEGSGGVPTQQLNMNEHCFDQLVKHVGIETRTARRCRQLYGPEFDALVNKMLRDDESTRIVRTYQDVDSPGIARAFLSDRFKLFDHMNILNAALPPLAEHGNDYQVERAVVTDKKLYLNLRSRSIQADREDDDGRAVGDVMALGMFLRNSETGTGSVALGNMTWTLACLNGMEKRNEKRFAHLTSSQGDGETWAAMTDEAKEADNKALELKIRDLAAAYSSRDAFDKIVEDMKAAARDHIAEGTEPQAAVQQLSQVLKLSKVETGAVMSGLFATLQQPGYVGQPVSRATMVNAVTAAAHKAAADDVTTWAQRGDAVLNLARNQWESVANAGELVPA